MDTAMHDMGSLGRMLQIDLPRDWANLALYRDVEGGGQPGLSFGVSGLLLLLLLLYYSLSLHMQHTSRSGKQMNPKLHGMGWYLI